MKTLSDLSILDLTALGAAFSRPRASSDDPLPGRYSVDLTVALRGDLQIAEDTSAKGSPPWKALALSALSRLGPQDVARALSSVEAPPLGVGCDRAARANLELLVDSWASKAGEAKRYSRRGAARWKGLILLPGQ